MTKEEAKEVLYRTEQFGVYDQTHEAVETVFKALEQEPCEDAVSRQAVDQNIYDYAESNGLSYANLKNAILDVPPVTPARKEWIPVSERLPEPNTAVLIYVGPSETFCLAYWNDIRGGWEEWIGIQMIETEMGYEVLAWMPLPESYEEGVERE